MYNPPPLVTVTRLAAVARLAHFWVAGLPVTRSRDHEARMPQASGYGAIDHSAAGEATGAVRPTSESDELPDFYDNRRVGRRWRNLAALSLGAAALGLAYTAQPSASGAPSLVEVSVGEAAAGQEEDILEDFVPPLSFEAHNFYHLRDGKPGQDYPWLRDVKLIEPHRETTLSISSPRDGHDYVWEVRGCEADAAELRASARGAETSVVLTELDENTITVKEVDSAGEVVRQMKETVMVKYVRREIRTLTEDERNELFDAVSPPLGLASTC